MVEFYLAKIESYMRRKHESLLNEGSTNDSKSTVDADEVADDEQAKALGDANKAEESKQPAAS